MYSGIIFNLLKYNMLQLGIRLELFKHYDDILLLLGIPSLKERRENICKLYFHRLTCTEHKLHHLLPVGKGVTYDIRKQNTYPLPLTRTDRFKNYLITYHWQ